MTDRIGSLTVALIEDVRSDDIQPLMEAIRQLRGVASVTSHVVEWADFSARARADLEWRKRILNLLGPTWQTP